MTQPCKICRGTGHVECPSQLCAHWCSCTVCNGTGKVEIVEDWSQGHLEETVRAGEFEPNIIEKPVVRVKKPKKENRDMSEETRENNSCETITLPCLCCGKEREYSVDSLTGQGVFNAFCDGDCEDRYAARL